MTPTLLKNLFIWSFTTTAWAQPTISSLGNAVDQVRARAGCEGRPVTIAGFFPRDPRDSTSSKNNTELLALMKLNEGNCESRSVGSLIQKAMGDRLAIPGTDVQANAFNDQVLKIRKGDKKKFCSVAVSYHLDPTAEQIVLNYQPVVLERGDKVAVIKSRANNKPKPAKNDFKETGFGIPQTDRLELGQVNESLKECLKMPVLTDIQKCRWRDPKDVKVIKDRNCLSHAGVECSSIYNQGGRKTLTFAVEDLSCNVPYAEADQETLCKSRLNSCVRDFLATSKSVDVQIQSPGNDEKGAKGVER